MTVLATVRNTGSHTIHAILAPMVLHFLEEDEQADDRFWFGHAEPGKLSLIREKTESEPPLILGMRNPVQVARSWIKRSKTLDATFKASWSALFGLKADVADSYWLPVDTPDRESYLEAIEARLGRKLRHDWTPKGVFTAQNYAWSGGMTVDEAREWLKSLPFDQFGYAL